MHSILKPSHGIYTIYIKDIMMMPGSKGHAWLCIPHERLDILMTQIKFDIHTHTIASGHATTATITDMAKAEAARNLKLLGISDHGPATAGGGRA